MKAKLSKEGGGYDLYRIDEDGKRVTFASTQDYKQKLSLKNCQAIERGYDLDELFDEVDESIDYHEFDFTSFRLGFQKAFELIGDKKFSEEDLHKAFELGKNIEREDCFENFLSWKSSLQQNEWDVEIEMEIYDDPDFMKDLNKEMRLTPKILHKPKLDQDGCLILKRVV